MTFTAMTTTEKWIWLPADRYPDRQKSHYHAESAVHDGVYTVAEFRRDYDFGCAVTEMKLRVSGDTAFRLYLNGGIIVSGPVCVGGDFLFNNEPRSKHYASELTVHPDTDALSFLAQVQLTPAMLSDYSHGHGGFMLWAQLTLADGRIKYICTDEGWLCRVNKAFAAPGSYDQSLNIEAFCPAVRTDNIWHCETSPLPPMTETPVIPENSAFTLAPGEEKCADMVFDMIHAGYVCLDVAAEGPVEVSLDCIETEPVCGHYDLKFNGSDFFRGFRLMSAGLYRVCAKNLSGSAAQIGFSMIASHYPVNGCAATTVSDAELNLVMDVCRHTLKYCRQTIHLDSPKHSEPLACTGDYYIESLMTAMSFGDMTLAEFDIERTAELLRMHDGRMFHTSYSLIWVQMLWDVYMITANRAMLESCIDALTLLMDRFETYVGENGLIETPPDYMFVDWIYIDEISLHHPPKALGQTCLCAYYYGALITAAKIYRAIGLDANAARCETNAASLREAVNSLLYDAEKGLYFDGLNTPTPEHLLYRYMPQNVEKRYYMPHSNILCARFGLCDDETGRRLIRKVVSDRDWGRVQPYFMHFLLGAVDRLDLRGECTLAILENWKEPIRECSKGLVEGFIAPEPTYSFDHSHAWGGTPLYMLPKHLLGLEIIEPGYRKIRLNPNLLGLESASVEVPTPCGTITVSMKQGHKPEITAPDGIEIVR